MIIYINRRLLNINLIDIQKNVLIGDLFEKIDEEQLELKELLLDLEDDDNEAISDLISKGIDEE